jgi:hypothetical protein
VDTKDNNNGFLTSCLSLWALCLGDGALGHGTSNYIKTSHCKGYCLISVVCLPVSLQSDYSYIELAKANNKYYTME